MLNSKIKISVADTHAGSGKTRSMHAFINGLDGFATIATQTNDLSREELSDLSDLWGVDALMISGDDYDCCTTEYLRHCKKLSRKIAIINQNVALCCYEEVAEQHLFIDEIPSPLEEFRLIEKTALTRRIIQSMLKARSTEFPNYYEILSSEEIAEYAKYGKRLDNSLRDLPKVFHELCKKISSRHFRVLVEADSFTNFQSGIDDDDAKKLTLYVWMQPSILERYKSVTIIGANFYLSKLYSYWKDMVEFVPHSDVQGARYSDFQHKSDLISLYHMSDDDVSGYKLHTKIGYQTFLDSVADVFHSEFGDVDHLYTVSAKGDFAWKLNNSTQVSANPVGVNGLQHVNVAIHLAPLNPSDAQFAIYLAVCGMTASQLMTAQAYEKQYQFLTRSSVRDYHSREELVFIVLDRRSAEFHQKIFGCGPSKLMHVPALNEYEAPPRKTRSDKKPAKSPEEIRAANAARARKAYEKKKAAQQAAA
ncbi:hypothetical protein [Endobacterium cereale]|uniref:hypothetical protein n=1 Tax=Endobacterium cereale TaxID=2663029 RepID=UPI002B49183A|nr:hypothetical protein [Endobacterium cereale]MEB2843794.1 hypothetical protein [Endobacterium cereale]